MSITKMVELYETIVAVTTRDGKLGEWVARELKHLRLTYMDAHKMRSVDAFAAHVGITKKHIYSLERDDASPTVDTLSQILTRCDTNLVEFFRRLVTHAELSNIERESAEERKWIHLLVMGLSNPKTRRTVHDAALNVSDLLEVLGVQ